MGKFVIVKHVKLDFLGEGWGEAFADFTPFTGKEMISLAKLDTEVEAQQKSLDRMIDLLQKHFIKGEGYNGKGLEPITKADLDELALAIFVKVIEVMRGEVANENFSTNSTPLS